MKRIYGKTQAMRTALLGKIQRLAQDVRGVAYLEFALAVPFLLMLFAGSVDVTRMVLLHQKVDKAVFTVGDLATQLQAQTGVCAIVGQWEETVVRDMLQPFQYDRSNYRFLVSSVVGRHPNGNPNGPVRDRIEWRYNPQNGGISVIGAYSAPYAQTATMPPQISGLRTDERVIVTEMRYRFTPLIPQLSNLVPHDFHKASYFRSRVSTPGALSQC